MEIKQEELSPIHDALINSHLSIAFEEITELAGKRVCDTEELKTYCEETLGMLKKFVKDIESIEQKEEKRINRAKFKEKLSRGDSLD